MNDEKDKEIDELKIRLAELYLEAKELQECNWCLSEELKRFKEGDLTKEELQSLCHNCKECNADEFADGCIEYNNKLFGVHSKLKKV